MKERFTPAAFAAALNGDMANAIVAMTPGGIEAQEAAGQAAMAKSKDRLPCDGDWIALQEMGVVRGEKVDEIFYRAVLPEGWKIVPTDHSMWSDLVDASGTKKASIFYKAAFYDRRASISVVR